MTLSLTLCTLLRFKRSQGLVLARGQRRKSKFELSRMVCMTGSHRNERFNYNLRSFLGKVQPKIEDCIWKWSFHSGWNQTKVNVFFSIYFCLSSSLGLKIFAPFSESSLNGNGICAATATENCCWSVLGLYKGFTRAYYRKGSHPKGTSNRNRKSTYRSGDEKYNLHLLVFNLASMHHNKRIHSNTS